MWTLVQPAEPSTDLSAPGTSSENEHPQTLRAPSARAKHAMCSTQDGSIYLLGGRSANLPLKDFWRFDPVQSHWEEVHCRGNHPPCLQEHTMVSWKNKLYVFGGEVGFASTGETPLWILDTSTSTWRKHHMRGTNAHQPTGRRGHTAVVYNGIMHVYGGYQDLRGSTSELWSFDFATEQWGLTLLPNNVDQPTPRHNHSSVVHDGNMWVYGGLTDLQEKGDFWRWDFAGKQWARVRAPKGPGELQSHSAVKALSSMYIFGGERGGTLLNELWKYHFATDVWERIHGEGALPTPRCRHVAVANPTLQNWDEKVQAWKESPGSQRSGHHHHHRHHHDQAHHHHNHHNQQTGEANASGSSSSSSGSQQPQQHHERVTNAHPPKSISMCFGQTTEPENGRRPFKFRVHPVSRLCSKSTSSDEEEDTEYAAIYNHNTSQVNLRSIREKISSSRLVRSISSGSYSILHNQANEVVRDELERLVEETPPAQIRHVQRPGIQKSHSSEAVLESDSETSTPQHQPRPHSEIITTTTYSPVSDVSSRLQACNSCNSTLHPCHHHHHHLHYPMPIHQSASSSGRRSSTTSNKITNGHGCACCCYHSTPSSASSSSSSSSSSQRGIIANHAHCETCHHGNQCISISRNSRLGYDGPLSTVRDVEEEEVGGESIIAPVAVDPVEDEGLDADELHPSTGKMKGSSGTLLIDLEDGDLPAVASTSGEGQAFTPPVASESHVGTSSGESVPTALPHSVSHSSGYHSSAEEEAGTHRDFAGCLNPSTQRRLSARSNHEGPVELKTFTSTHLQPNEQGTPASSSSSGGSHTVKERAHSWDRASQRRDSSTGSNRQHHHHHHHHSHHSSRTTTPSHNGHHHPSDSSPSWASRVLRDEVNGVSPNRRWPYSPGSRPRIEHHDWQLCLYVFGGLDQGLPGLYRQPLSVWKLYV